MIVIWVIDKDGHRWLDKGKAANDSLKTIQSNLQCHPYHNHHQHNHRQHHLIYHHHRHRCITRQHEAADGSLRTLTERRGKIVKTGPGQGCEDFNYDEGFKMII